MGQGQGEGQGQGQGEGEALGGGRSPRKTRSPQTASKFCAMFAPRVWTRVWTRSTLC